MKKLITLLSFPLLLGACATANVANRCPESKRVRCMTAPECSYDKERDCHVCSCSSPRMGEGVQGDKPPERINKDLPLRP